MKFGLEFSGTSTYYSHPNTEMRGDFVNGQGSCLKQSSLMSLVLRVGALTPVIQDPVAKIVDLGREVIPKCCGISVKLSEVLFLRLQVKYFSNIKPFFARGRVAIQGYVS